MLRILIVFLAPLFFESIDYKKAFSDNYADALDFISENANLIFDYSSAYDTDPEIIMPVLFPEAIRYSIVSDYLETKSLELVYVYSGSTDFSIGYFQMKPSFAENLEQSISSYPQALSKYDSLLIPDDWPPTEIRKERLERLKKLEYQVAYVNCMYDILKILHPSIFKLSKEFQIRFASTAFNHGFLSGKDEIIEYSDKAFFPMNGKNNTPRYKYSEISLYFYQNDLPLILSKKK